MGGWPRGGVHSREMCSRVCDVRKSLDPNPLPLLRINASAKQRMPGAAEAFEEWSGEKIDHDCPDNGY